MWQVLEDAGLTPSVVTGTSMGGLVGAFIAAGYSGAELERISGTVSWRRLLDWRPGTGLLRISAMEGWLAQHLPLTFEELHGPAGHHRHRYADRPGRVPDARQPA